MGVQRKNGNLKEAIGLAYLGLGDLEKARTLLESRPSGDAAVLAALAIIYAKQNKREQAQRLYQAAIERRKSLSDPPPLDTYLDEHMERLAKQALETLPQ